MPPVRLFVYGTLMRGGCRHELLANQRFLGPAHTTPHFALYDLCAYPGLVRCESNGQSIEGELYEIDAEILPRLDAVEGVPDLYRREEIELQGVPGRVVTYIYQRSVIGRCRINTGRWQIGPQIQ